MVQKVFKERLQPKIQRRTKAAVVIQKAFKQNLLDKKLLDYCCRSCRRDADDTFLRTIRSLLEKGANVNVRDKTGRTVFMRVCFRACFDFSHIKIAKILLEYGANVNARGKDGETALLEVCEIGKENINVVKLLLRAGADVNIRSTYTPLILSCLEENIHAVDLLLRAGADVNARDHEYYSTALMFVCNDSGGNINLVKLLLRAGADVNIPDEDNKTPFDAAENKPEILKLLYAKKYKNMYNSLSPTTKSVYASSARIIQHKFRTKKQRRTQAAVVIQRRIRQLPRIKAARTIQSVVRRHRATNKNSRLSKNAITLERIPRRNSIALNGQMYHRNSVASLVALGNARVPHSRRRIVTGANGRYTTA